jgi:threonine dehydratase
VRVTRCCFSPTKRASAASFAASAGNHAQGVAYHGSLLGIPVTVVMPKFAAFIKVTNCRQLGARVILHGADLTEARAHAEAIAAQEGLTFIIRSTMRT